MWQRYVLERPMLLAQKTHLSQRDIPAPTLTFVTEKRRAMVKETAWTDLTLVSLETTVVRRKTAAFVVQDAFWTPKYPACTMRTQTNSCTFSRSTLCQVLVP
jgi:hypothetical protein